MYFTTLLILTFSAFLCNAQDIVIPTPKVCGPVCEIFCEYGNVLDANGCKTCACIDPCANHPCPKGEVCKVEHLLCTWPPCPYIARCVPECPLIKCAVYCPYGYELDVNGCRTCICIDHCKSYPCPKGEICIAKELCPVDQCGIRIKCVKKCPTLPCHLVLRCRYGFKLDCYGCPTCECIQPCKKVICPENHYCDVEIIRCLVAPCPPPYAVCRPYCPNGAPLLGADNLPTPCSAETPCPVGYTCNNIAVLGLSYCCSE